MLVVLGPVLEVPVTDLFAAAIVPGLLLAFLYTTYSLVRCWLDPALGPPLPKEEHPESFRIVLREFSQGLVPPAALVGFALGSILFGWATPTASPRGRLRGVRRPRADRRLRQAEREAFQ